MTAVILGCGGATATTPDTENAPEAAPASAPDEASADEATLVRCQELTELLLRVPGTGNEDLMLTAHYAYEELYPSCLDALDRTLSPGPERDLSALAYQVVHLQSLRIATEVYYAEGASDALCASAESGTQASDAFFDAINATSFPDDPVVTERTLQLRMIGLESTRFFAAVTSELCTPQVTP